MSAAPAMPALRWRARWHALGWVLVLAVIIGSLLPLRQRAGFAGLDKFEHFVGYALLMYWFAALHAPVRRPWIAIGLIALGGALELAQGATTWRHADSMDLLADAFGVVGGWALAHLTGESLFLRVERAAR